MLRGHFFLKKREKFAKDKKGTSLFIAESCCPQCPRFLRGNLDFLSRNSFLLCWKVSPVLGRMKMILAEERSLELLTIGSTIFKN